MFYCYGCHVGGDVIKFVMQIESLSFVEAIKLLASWANMEVPENFEGNKNNSYVELNRLVCDYVNDPEVTVSGVRFVLHKDCVKDYYGNFITKKNQSQGTII